MRTSAAGWFGAACGMFAVAWGANQFVSVLVLYRTDRGLSTSLNDALFASYALALIVALLLGGPAADLWGRARVVRPSVVLSLVASLALIAGENDVPLLFVGRIVAGLASGGIFAAGTAWVKELSTGAAEDAGARRAALALSLGFGVGPLVTGVVAQWAPHPLVTAYLPHIAMTLMALPAVRAAPETVRPVRGAAATRGYLTRLRVPSAGQPRFRGVVAPAAPWVFAAPALAFVVLPGLVGTHLHGYAPLFAGVVAAMTLGTGVLIQPLARRLDRPGQVTGSLLGLGAAVVGTGVCFAVALTGLWVLVLVAALPLGAAYGLGLVSGLLETQRLAGPDDLAGLTGVYYALTYVGFALPLVLAEIHAAVSYPVLMIILGILAALSALLVRVNASRVATPAQPGVLRSESAAETR